MKLILLFLMIFLPLEITLAGPKYGILGQQAPEFPKLTWYDEKQSKVTSPSLKSLKGKIIYLHFFQSWCPGCLSSGLPDLKRFSDKYKSNSKIKFFAIQTVFEGFLVNTSFKLKKIRKRFELQVPMAHDDGKSSGLPRSSFMRLYRSGGTPWTVIIDQTGKVIFNEFHLGSKRGELILKKLLR